MEIIDIFQKPLQKTPTILALGLFDGVHIGHKALLKETVRIAKEKGVLPAVFTFHQTAYKKARIHNFLQILAYIYVSS